MSSVAFCESSQDQDSDKGSVTDDNTVASGTALSQSFAAESGSDGFDR